MMGRQCSEVSLKGIARIFSRRAAGFGQAAFVPKGFEPELGLELGFGLEAAKPAALFAHNPPATRPAQLNWRGRRDKKTPIRS